ncbi:MAG: 50S ribosomal protein L32 [Deltaproteobacteria bacterium]|nr:50S ribosomal protein L32 [Deltaproteobacteria bacterium]
MPVPKRRTSRSKRNKRRSHDALATPQWSTCPKCGEVSFPHRACPSCGYYRGRPVLPTEET